MFATAEGFVTRWATRYTRLELSVLNALADEVVCILLVPFLDRNRLNKTPRPQHACFVHVACSQACSLHYQFKRHNQVES